MLLRSWCPSCVLGQARDKHHQRRGQCEDGLSEVVFGCCFLGGEGVEETVAISVATGRRTRKIFAQTAPQNSVTREFGASARFEECEKRGYKEMILRRDGEFALNALPDEVKARRDYQTVVANSPAGDRRANGATERAVQAVEK